jgi:hypothetical protein
MAGEIQVVLDGFRRPSTRWWFAGTGVVLAVVATILGARDDDPQREVLTPSASTAEPSSTATATSLDIVDSTDTTLSLPTSPATAPESSASPRTGANAAPVDVEAKCGPTPDFRLPDFTGLTQSNASSAFPTSWSSWIACYNRLTGDLIGAVWTYHDTCTTDPASDGQFYDQSPAAGTRFGPGTAAFQSGTFVITITGYRYSYCPPPPTEPATTTATT